MFGKNIVTSWCTRSQRISRSLDYKLYQPWLKQKQGWPFQAPKPKQKKTFFLDKDNPCFLLFPEKIWGKKPPFLTPQSKWRGSKAIQLSLNLSSEVDTQPLDAGKNPIEIRVYRRIGLGSRQLCFRIEKRISLYRACPSDLIKVFLDFWRTEHRAWLN